MIFRFCPILGVMEAQLVGADISLLFAKIAGSTSTIDCVHRVSDLLRLPVQTMTGAKAGTDNRLCLKRGFCTR